jgi:pimeloyl-ACP methyl ester carboxylesterase
MIEIRDFFRMALPILAIAAISHATTSAAAENSSHLLPSPAARIVDLKASDGTHLKASYFAALKPGPGVLLLHQANRERRVWDELAARLAAAGINTLTLDMRGHGESDQPTDAERKRQSGGWPGDIDTAFEYLLTQPGVRRDVIGLGGAGALGVGSAVQAARRHPAEVKALALLSGETVQDGLQFMRDAPQLPGLFVAADDDEYPPTVEAMELLYITSSSASKKWVHYPAVKEAPWIWYETADISKVPPTGGHGTDLFKVHPELPAIIVNWFITTLIETPGRAPADTLASAQILSQLRMPGGVAQVEQQLSKARQIDANTQLFPEIAVSIIGNDHLRAGEPEAALEVFKLNVRAYPDSADAHEDLAEAYLSIGQKDLARQHAQKTLALLDAHTVPASSWSDTEPRRGEIRRGAQNVLTKLSVTRQ